MQIVDVVKPMRDSLDACLVFPSMPAVMKMNKLGTFSMAQLGESKSPVAQFMKNMRKSNDNFEESMLKLVRTLPHSPQVYALTEGTGNFLPATQRRIQNCN